MKPAAVFFLVPLLFCFGCISTQLDYGGIQVEYVMKQEAPKEYTLIGPVEISGLESGATYPDAIVRLRNKAAKMGGDFLVIDDIEYQNVDITIYYIGNGRVYSKK